MKALGYGIDFGTTNSAIAVAYDDRVEVLQLEADSSLPTMLPSITYLHRSGNRLAGTEAARTSMVTGANTHRCAQCELAAISRQYRAGGGCLDSRLLSGLKLDLSDQSFNGTDSWGQHFQVEELIAVVLRRLKRDADRSVGEDIGKAVIGYPLAFPGTEGSMYRVSQALAQQRLRSAAELAGFDEIRLLPEPQAAALVEDVDVGTVLALDFGGGTFDAAVIRFEEQDAEVTALQGAAVGGELIDRALFREKVAPVLGLEATFAAMSGARLSMPNWMRTRFQSLAGIKHLVADPSVASWIRERTGEPGGEPLKQLDLLLFGGHAYAFYKAIEEAKVNLSSVESTSISYQRPGLSVDIPLNRNELELMSQPFLVPIMECVERALSQADISSREVSYVVNTGGSSMLTSYQRMVAERFGADRIVNRDPFNTVVCGLGYEAQGRWQA